MSSREMVAIFWDYENCHPALNLSGYEVVSNIRRVAHEFGNVTLFKAYLELAATPSSKSLSLRSELQSSGVSLTDCPHNGRKDVADKMILVDMLAYAIDNQAPTTIILITGDRDFAYAVSVLRLRRYRVVIVAPPIIHISLKSQASVLVDWSRDILGKFEADPESPKKPPSFVNESNSEYFTKGCDVDRKTRSTPFSCSLVSSSTTGPSERVEGVEHTGQRAGSSIKNETDIAQYGPKSKIPMHGVSRGHANASGASVADTNIRSIQPVEPSRTNLSSFQQSSGESTEPIYPSDMLGRFPTPMTPHINAPGQLGHSPGMSPQAPILLGGAPPSTVEPKLGFGMGSTQRSSLFGISSHQAATSGDLGSRNDSLGIFRRHNMTSVSTAKPYQFGTVNGSAAGVSSFMSTEAHTGRSLLETPEVNLGSADDNAYPKAPVSSFGASTTVQACPGAIGTSRSPSVYETDYRGRKVTDAVAANSLPGSRGSRSDGHGVPENSGRTSVSKAKPSHPGTTETSPDDWPSSPSTEFLKVDRTFIEMPETCLGATSSLTSSSSEDSSFVTSTSVRTCPGILETPHSPSHSDHQTANVAAATSLPTTPRILATPPRIAKIPSVASETSSVGRSVLDHASLPPVDANAYVTTSNHDSVAGEFDEATAPVSSKTLAPEFRILVEQLELQLEKGVSRPLRSVIAEGIMKQDPSACKQASMKNFREYIALAVEAGIVATGGVEDRDWMSLHPAWQPIQPLTSSAIKAPPPKFSGKEVKDSSAMISQQILPEREQAIAITDSAAIGDVQHPDVVLQPSLIEINGQNTRRVTVPSSSVTTTHVAYVSSPEIAIADHIRVDISSPIINFDSLPSKSVPPEFIILVNELKAQQKRGVFRPSRSNVAIDLVKQDSSVYSRAGVSKFKDYIALAVEAQIVVIGGTQGDAWISLASKQDETPVLRSKGTAISTLGTSNTPQVPAQFRMLVEQLRKSRLNGIERPLRSAVGYALIGQSQSLYQDAGFKSFKEYAAAAEKAGIIQLGGSDGQAWISLCSALS